MTVPKLGGEDYNWITSSWLQACQIVSSSNNLENYVIKDQDNLY